MRRVYFRPGPEFTGIRTNDGAVQEMTFGQGAEALDMGQSGMRVNIVPKSGGNVFARLDLHDLHRRRLSRR